MSKLKNKSDVIEWYWPDFLRFCMTGYAHDSVNSWFDKDTTKRRALPTEDNFWHWYITDGPMGVKHANRFYSKEDVEYV